jgi:hypothetical protein
MKELASYAGRADEKEFASGRENLVCSATEMTVPSGQLPSSASSTSRRLAGRAWVEKKLFAHSVQTDCIFLYDE